MMWVSAMAAKRIVVELDADRREAAPNEAVRNARRVIRNMTSSKIAVSARTIMFTCHRRGKLYRPRRGGRWLSAVLASARASDGGSAAERLLHGTSRGQQNRRCAGFGKFGLRNGQRYRVGGRGAAVRVEDDGKPAGEVAAPPGVAADGLSGIRDLFLPLCAGRSGSGGGNGYRRGGA